MYEEINLVLNIVNIGTSVLNLVCLFLLNKQILFNNGVTCLIYHDFDERLKNIEKTLRLPPPPYTEQNEYT